MKWYCVAWMAVLVPLVGGCNRNSPPVAANATGTPGQPATPAKRPPLTRADGERKYNDMKQQIKVRTPLADVVKYFGQEPDRTETRGDMQHAVWVLDDGSELDVEFYNGLSGSSTATFKNKK